MTQKEGRPIISEITCQKIVRWTSAYLDEHIEDERKRQIAAHLAVCAGCETYVNQIATVRKVAGLLPKAVDEPPDSQRLKQVFVARARRSLSAAGVLDRSTSQRL